MLCAAGACRYGLEVQCAICAIGGAVTPPMECVAVVWNSWSRLVDRDCGDRAGNTRTAPTAVAHYTGATGGGLGRTRPHATRL